MAKLQTVNGTAGKETLYVDVDDEITAIIDKVGAAKGKIVALVLPKRCPVLQSVVNMKLLKRAADTAGKNLVLVTTEAGLMPLAGATGLYVASSPTSKPSIPDMPGPAADGPEDLDEPLKVVDGNASEAGDDDFDPKAAGRKSIGELATGSAVSQAAADDETIDMDDEPDEAPIGTIKLPKVKKDRKLKVPNFDSFRKKIALGVFLLVLLIVGWVFAFTILPAATVTISTDSSTIPTNLNLTLDTAAKTLDAASSVVPATAQSQQKTATQTVQSTGQQNNGPKATGSVKLTQKVCAPNLGQTPPPVPTGSSVSSSGHTYVTQESAAYTFSSFTGGNCALYSTNPVDITALKGGQAYNVPDGSNFTGPSGATGTGSASGGDDDIVTVVQQSDIDGATNKINAGNSDSVKQQLESNLESKGLLPVTATFLAGDPQVTTNAKVGDQTSSVTVTSVTTYTMLGIKKSDLQTLVLNNVNGQLDKGKQVVLDDGVANAQFTENTAGTATSATVAVSVKSQAGPQLDTASLKKQLAGMKSGDVQSFVKQTPGVTDVKVKYSPFWVNTVPKKAAKVTIHIDKAGN